MNQVKLFAGIRYAIFLAVLFLTQAIVWAQDSTTSSSTTTTTTREETTWYTSPILWVAGAALFILLLAAILKGSSGSSSRGASERVTVSKTVSRDSDVA